MGVKVKTIHLMGGFGNQLFQTLMLLSLRDKGYGAVLNQSYIVKNPITKLINWKIHDSILKPISNGLKIKTIEENTIITLVKILKLIISKMIKRKFLNVYFFPLGPNVDNIQIEKAKDLFGYYQNFSFLDQNKIHIESLVTQINKSFKNIVSNDKKFDTVVHFRLGDSAWAIENYDYYISIRERLDFNEKFVVITDSPSEAYEFFKNFNNKIIIKNKPEFDFSIMLNSKTLYTSPSTFSYWAATCLDIKSKVILSKMIFNRFGFFGKANYSII